jgi:2-polyprenyl-3-methyl-5-hydroxy-6-metoxy-1,4-benzoquinol methylase
MWLSERILFNLAKLFYRTEAAHSEEMKGALSSADKYETYRHGQLDFILSAMERFGITMAGKVVLDLGCNDGAITVGYPEEGASRVIGVDIDHEAIQKAQARRQVSTISFVKSATGAIPVVDGSVDVIVCFDVFEHVAQPELMLQECRRVLSEGGKMLIGTWGWYHPYAPHLWSTMPVPWAHVFFSERTLLRTCRRVYHSPWYVPNMHDFDANGNRIENKYEKEVIPRDYLNKMLIRDYERVFRKSLLKFKIHPQPFGSKFARWTKLFLTIPWIREFITAYIWVVLEKAPQISTNSGAASEIAPTHVNVKLNATGLLKSPSVSRACAKTV